MRVAIIPARGGSKRIPRKNIRLFCGRPIVAWSIDAARASGCFDRIIVSTDDEEVAAVAQAAGAEAPFRRPAELADDHAATVPVIAHAVQWLRQSCVCLEEVCCIYATAPLLAAGDLARGLRMLNESEAQYAFSCTTFDFPIQRALRLDVNGRIEPMFPSDIARRSQDLPLALHDAGQFYWGRPDAFAQQRPIFAPHSVPVVIPRHRVQDIDTEEDWTCAELLFQVFREIKP